MIINEGDSGGISYKIISGTSGRTVGTADGYNISASYFIKGAAILQSLGIHIY